MYHFNPCFIGRPLYVPHRRGDGLITLESGGFEVDPRNEKLKRLPTVLLKAAHGFVLGIAEERV